jgi:metacaspase-1
MAKKALLVGLNRYPEPINALRGCLNDVDQVRGLIQSRLRFPDRGISTLTDAAATTAAIVDRLHWLVEDASAGDTLLFHYSGHGSQVEDVHGDELDDNLDEIICPYDLDWTDPFTDDDLYQVVRRLPAGVNLTVFLDCCHSGTGLRELRGGAGPTACEPGARRRPRFMEPPQGGDRRLRLRAMRRFGARAAQSGAILVAACRSDQVAADASIGGDYHGAFTYYLCQALEESACASSYSALIQRVRRLLDENGFDQVPQLEGPAPLLKLPVFAAPVELEFPRVPPPARRPDTPARPGNATAGG